MAVTNYFVERQDPGSPSFAQVGTTTGTSYNDTGLTPRDAGHNEVFSVDDTKQNYRVREIAEIVGEVFPGCQISFGPPNPDNRSYRVSFDKIRERLPDFQCAWDARLGARELYNLFQRIEMAAEVFQHRAFTRLNQIEYLIRTRQIDDHFFWTDSSVLNES